MAAGGSIEQYAAQLKMSAEDLLAKLREAGIEKNSVSDSLSVKDKLRLREHMTSRFSKPAPVTRTRKTLQDGVVIETRVSSEVTADQASKKEEAAKPVYSEKRVGMAVDTRRKNEKKAPEPVAESEPQAAAPVEASQAAPGAATTASSERSREKPHASRKATNAKDKKREEAAKRERMIMSRSKKSGRRGNRIPQSSALEQEFELPTKKVIHTVELPPGSIMISDLAQKMSVKGVEVIKKMMQMGMMTTINQSIDQETAAIVVDEMGHKPLLMKENARESEFLDDFAAQGGESGGRAPVVTIMGHVDHGKTSLLDYIRRTKVTSQEAGGITQHIGAYQVETPRGCITFLDTPGHEAFTAMRARGAQATDIIVLVVAADDGVKPQTIEAIQHARAAKVPLIVAVNKMDKDGIDLDRVMTELSQHEVICEDWGGDTIFQKISAKTGLGIDELLESIVLQSEVLELSSINTGPARGLIIESRLDKGRGPVATVLVTQGELNKGDIVLAGTQFGRVRAMLGDAGDQRDDAGPSMPVEILGLSGVPEAGDEVFVVKDERKAREMSQFRQTKQREDRLAKKRAMQMDRVMGRFGSNEEEQMQLNVVLKADVQGSLEAIVAALQKLSNEDVCVSIVSSAVGGLTESDANLALASNAVMIGFNVRADAAARQVVTREGLDLRYFSVIYDLIDAIKDSMGGLLAPRFEDQIIGLAQVRDVFRSSKLGAIAGCIVSEGVVKRDKRIRVLRDNVVIFEGELESLRRFKDDVNEVKHGTECGIGVKNYNDIKPGDQIEVYESVQVERTLKTSD